MLVESLPCYIAGSRVEPRAESATIHSIDGAREVPVAEVSSVELRRALREADKYQERLHETSLEERVAAAQLVLREYDRRSGEVGAALAQFRGLATRDARWMCAVNTAWGEHFEELVRLMFDGEVERNVVSDGRPLGQLRWQSKGKSCLFSSSTMDGPAAVVALCHAMISGTHLLLRPSYRDAATHLAFETLYEHGLQHYAQLVRWQSQRSDAALLNRQLLANVSQAVIFSSNETFRELLASAAAPGSPEWDALYARCKRYGTGLPLAVVTERCDLDSAAHDLIEGARLGGGRFCLSAGPVLVERRCHEPLVRRVAELARGLRCGSPLDVATDLSSHEADSAEAIRIAVQGFGGIRAHGEVRTHDMDLLVLADVPTSSSALSREVPGSVLSFIPVDDLQEATSVASNALRQNHREAWTAVAVFGDERDFQHVARNVESFRYLRGGVVARVKLVLPHQGSYFALDLMRRVSWEER